MTASANLDLVRSLFAAWERGDLSEQNIELLRRFTEAFNTRDIEALIACCDPNIEFHSAWTAVAPAVYHGHDGMRTCYDELEDAWDGVRSEPEAYFDLGEVTLVFLVMHARGRHSGAEVAMSMAPVYRLRDGLIVYFKAYVHRQDALRDLGVSEEELEPIEP